MSTEGPTRCHRCGGDLDHDREVEQSVREGGDVAIVSVRADVCQRCGEVLLHPGMVDRMAEAKQALRRGTSAPQVGRVFDLRHRAA